MTAARFFFRPTAVRALALLAWLTIGPAAVAQEADSVGLRRDSVLLPVGGLGQERAVRLSDEWQLPSVSAGTDAEPTMTFTAPDVSASAPPYYTNPPRPCFAAITARAASSWPVAATICWGRAAALRWPDWVCRRRPG